MDYLITPDLIEEVNEMVQEIYQCDESGLMTERELTELNASYALNEYIMWLEDQVQNRKDSRMINIMGAHDELH